MPAPPPKSSGTVVVIRDADAGLELLLLERFPKQGKPGPWVFPGGKVDASAPEGDPRRREYTHHALQLADDQLPADTLVQRLYRCDVLTDFVRRVQGKAELYRYADEFQALNIVALPPGSWHGWHYDYNECTVTLLLQAAEEGGAEAGVVRSLWERFRGSGRDLLFAVIAGFLLVAPGLAEAGYRTNEVYFEDVRVPATALVGEENGGWYYAAHALDYERVSIFTVSGVRAVFDALLEWAREPGPDGRRPADDPDIRTKLANFQVEIQVLQMLSFRNLGLRPVQEDTGRQELLPVVELGLCECHLFGAEFSCERLAYDGDEIEWLER